MSTWVAALVAAAAITLTYVFCVRPMLRGRAADSHAEDPEIVLREELRVLRAQQKQPPQPSRARGTRSGGSRDVLGR